jgi:hypothetical protein
MRVVQVAEDGALELTWMWLPTFIGQNYLVLKELEGAWRGEFPGGVPNDDVGLDALHNFTITWLAEKFGIPGLDKYLQGITHIKDGDDAVHKSAS